MGNAACLITEHMCPIQPNLRMDAEECVVVWVCGCVGVWVCGCVAGCVRVCVRACVRVVWL